MPFADKTEVVVKQLDDENWEVRKALAYEGKKDRFEVPVGQGTDFASVPRVFVWFLPRYGSYTMAAILHDYLWRERAAKGGMDWIDADGIFRRAMRELNVPFLRRWMMWAAVRWGALLKPRGRRRWFQEAWRVLLFTVLAIPFVVPPALIILASLGVFYVVELLLWVPIRVTATAKSAVRKEPPRKEVNLPSFGFKMTGPPADTG